MGQAMDHGAIERAMGGTSNGSESNRRSEGWYEQLMKKQEKERRMVQEMNQGSIEGAMEGASG